MYIEKLLRRIYRFLRENDATETTKFFSKDYASRVAEIRSAHHLNIKKGILRADFFNKPQEDSQQDIKGAPRFADDILVGLAKVIRPQCVMQLGCWSLAELETLMFEGVDARLIATDFNEEYVRFLEGGYRDAGKDDYKFQTLDIESAGPSEVEGVVMLSAIQVLANIQPEGMEHFAGTLRATQSVKCVLIGDNYSWQSIDPRNKQMSLPQPHVKNWFHNYPLFAELAGFDCVFLPDMILKTNNCSRGVFILSRGVPREDISAATRLAVERFVGRQKHIWLVR
jgi:hypothetical protein